MIYHSKHILVHMTKHFCCVEKSLLTSAVNYGKALESFIPIVSVSKCNCHVTGPFSLYFMAWIEHRAGVKCGCSEQINVRMGCWFCCWFKLAVKIHSFIAPSLCFYKLLSDRFLLSWTGMMFSPHVFFGQTLNVWDRARIFCYTDTH